MFDSNPDRHRCRNPRCKVWLKEPVASLRDAFCCTSCEAGFYRTHCRVCERELGNAKRNSRRELCGRRQCRNQFRSFRHQFFSVWYPSASGASKPEKSSTKSTPKTGIKSDRAWRKVAGPDVPEINYRIPLDPELVARLNRQHNRYWIDDALIGPNDPPVNILGGYKFPNAPAVDLNPIAPKTEKQKFSPDQQKRLDELRAQILADLSIPAFLWRSS
jgi:hypothetical protein